MILLSFLVKLPFSLLQICRIEHQKLHKSIIYHSLQIVIVLEHVILKILPRIMVHPFKDS